MLTTKLNTSREVLFSFVILEDTSITFQYGSIHYELWSYTSIIIIVFIMYDCCELETIH